jgi:hypothetical protein|tara:strand:+ start:122 stop:619 length:498 start_codon:yes stop_codon:yes gene_type:complete
MNRFYTGSTALQIRLDTKPIIDDIELFLRGARIIVEQDEKGKITSKKVKVGEQKANDLGIQSILNIVSAIFNPQVVQGNFDIEQWEFFVYQFHINLSTNIVNNCYNWQIIDDDMDIIIDFIMPLVEAFTSRMIDNEERKSYSDTIKTIESNPIQRQGGLGLFKNG